MRQRSGMAGGAPIGGATNRVRMSSQGGGGGGGDGDGGDTYVTSLGYEQKPGVGQKVGNSLKGLLLGPVVIFVGCLLLWHNEKWAIKTHRSLNEAKEAFVAIDDAQERQALEAYRGKLVHLTHPLSVEDAVRDPVFDLTRPNAVSLKRTVEIYQWVESITKKRVQRGKETEVQEVVKYNKKWVPHPVDSQEFRHVEGHENCCGSLPMPSKTFEAAQVQMGLYSLSPILKQQLKQTNEVSPSQAQTLPQGAQRAGGAIYLPRGGGGGQPNTDHHQDLNQAIEEKVMRMDGEERTMFTLKATGESFSTRQKALEAAAKNNNNNNVASSNSQQQRNLSLDQAEIGDVRITFQEVPCTTVSVLAKLADYGNTLTKWSSRQGSGYEIAVLHYGQVSAAQMVEAEQSSNTVKTWLFRGGGWLLNFIGFAMITNIVTTTADITLNWIPILGGMATSLINLGVGIANFILANCTTLLVASIAWVVYRPILGVSLLAGSLGLFFTASSMGRAKGGGSGAGMNYQFSEKER